MDIEAEVLSGQEPIASYPVDSDEPMSLEDAVRDLGSAREKALNPPAESAEKPATADIESSVEGDAAPEEGDPGEVEDAEPEEEKLPPIERPRSWSKDDDDEWAALPRARQEKIAANERAREADINQKISKAAETAKVAEAKVAEAEQVRQQLEAGVKAARDVLDREQRTKFPDIKSWDDYERLSAEASRLSEIDPFTSLKIANYLKDFDTHQKSMQFNALQTQKIETEKAKDRQSKRVDYETEQNKLLIELVPEMADPKKANELRERAVAMLTDANDIGLKNDQLSRWMQDDTGHEILSNAGIQKLIADGLKYREIKSAKTAVASRVVPLVQRPGTAKPATAGTQASIQALEKQLSNATGDRAVEISTQIYQLEQKAAARQKG